MNKYETLSYYEALGDNDKLVCIDSSDSITDIKNAINEKVENSSIGKFLIEIFHEEIGIKNYAMLKQSESEPIFDLWTNMSKIAEKKTPDEIADIISENMPKTVKSPFTKYIDSVDGNGTYTVKSFTDPAFCKTMGFAELMYYSEQLGDEKILGEFTMGQSIQKEYHAVNHADISVFSEILDKIDNKAMRLYAETCLRIIPDYVFTEPASNDSYTRPVSDLAEQGLLRHLINTANIIDYCTTLDYAKIKFTQHERDMMIIAAMFHDCLKYGWQETYKNDCVELFEHPRLAANALRCIRGIISDNDIKFITNGIESHMGNNNTNPDDINSRPLPTPDTECKYMIHLADFIATRKNIGFVHGDTVYTLASQNIQTIEDFTPISEAEKNILLNVLDMDVDDKIAKELSIIDSHEEIRKIWRHIVQTNRVITCQLKYIELAKRMMFC